MVELRQSTLQSVQLPTVVGLLVALGLPAALSLTGERRRNLPACMLMHVLNDGFAFLVLPLFM